MGSSHVLPCLNRSSAIRRSTAGSPQMRHMDEQVTYRLWRSSMGRSKVAARWLVITICTSVGSAISDMITAWIELWRVDDGEPEG